MYALAWGEKFWCDWFQGTYFNQTGGWQTFKHCHNIYLEQDAAEAAARVIRLSKIYIAAKDDIEVIELSDEQLESITFMKLQN